MSPDEQESQTPGQRSHLLPAIAIGLVAGVLAGALDWNSSREPADERPDRSWATRQELADYADLPPADDRILEAAAALEEAPLYVDPALSHMLPPDERAAVIEALDAGPPIYVVIAPFIRQDGMGGNTDAAVIALSDEVGRDGHYVIIDQDRHASSVDRYGDALTWLGASVYDGRLSSVIPRMYPPDRRTQWIPEDNDVD
ncbi:hypothetical protein [Phytoactinopolyspora limicola]|uniref:hypothetical protein n=1 Tax=Phytoactinopolyspora limicola TaxID=2715536 RepID=UPI00140D2A5E|nr:hypothetical protein [Phytoactinopolyspora limicola]